MTSYGLTSYWEERYKRDAEPFDWYQQYGGLRETFLSIGFRRDEPVLVVGCGTSLLSESMLDDGFECVVNIDNSGEAIAIMERRRPESAEKLKYILMDVMRMEGFDSRSFSQIIDKGTADAILCGAKSAENIKTMLLEVARVLNEGGTFICISFGLPNFRLGYLQDPDLPWTVQVKTLSKPTTSLTQKSDLNDDLHYIYVCTKTTPQ